MASETLTNGTKRQTVRASVDSAAQRAYDNAALLDDVAAKSIANEAAAYALTGLSAGARYKTADTGDVMEYLGDVMGRYAGFTISGSSATDSTALSYNGTFKFDGWQDGYPRFTDAATGQMFSGVWGQILAGSNASGHYSTASPHEHPADIATWTGGAGSGSLLNSEFTKDAPESNVYNWKVNGVIKVWNNNDKRMLRNLPAGQVVQVVGEGDRLERYNGPIEDPGAEDAFVIDWNVAGDPLITYQRAYSAMGLYEKIGSDPWYTNLVGPGGALIDYMGANYALYVGDFAFESPAAAASVKPWDVVGDWTPVSSNATGTIDDAGINQTGEANARNWTAITNTVELTIYDEYITSNFSVNGVSVPSFSKTNVGWVRVGERVETENGSQRRYAVTKINGTTANTSGTEVICASWGDDFVVPDAFPVGASVELTNGI